MTNFVLDTQTLLTTIGIAIFTAMAVSNLVKPAFEARGLYKENPRYPLYTNVAALIVAELFSISGLIIAQLALDSPHTLLLALVRGFAAAFFATGGYEAYVNIRKFTGGP